MKPVTFAVLAAASVLLAIFALPGLQPKANNSTTAATATTSETGSSRFTGADKIAIEKIVKDYLIENPEVFLEIQSALEAKMEKQQAEKFKAALAENAKDIYRRAGAPVAGNINGDITVTEFFDYNCGYCKKSLGDIQALIQSDSKVRVVLKELPILSQDSVDAAKIALAAKQQGKYWEVHSGLLESKARATGEAAIAIATRLGLDIGKLKADAEGEAVKAEIDAVRQLAQKMGIEGTPHFLVGDRSFAGVPPDLKNKLLASIADLRKAGCSYC